MNITLSDVRQPSHVKDDGDERYGAKAPKADQIATK